MTKRDDVKQLAVKIENLAKEVQKKLFSGEDVLAVSNELVRNNATFVFTLGELYAIEQYGLTNTAPASSDKKPATIVSNPNNTKPATYYHKYHNVRDSYGRFSTKP